ncbi:MAG: GH25 family lysozyme [Paracoccaceae bacterium]
MTDLRLSRRRFASLALAASTVASVAACARRPEPAAGVPEVPEVEVTRARFGDADPHDWTGPSPARYAVHGIDVSRWQIGIDWPVARANGVNFAFVKATEGGDHANPAFDEAISGARAAGVPAGAYHFWYHCRSGREQARWFIRNVPRRAGSLPPVLDIEWTPFSPTCRDRPPAREVRAEAASFLRTVEAHYGVAAIVYATPDIWEDAELWKLPGGHEYWLRSVTAHPSERYAGRDWTFWQYSGTGIVPGIPGKTDVNAFRGSAGAWARWLAMRLV